MLLGWGWVSGDGESWGGAGLGWKVSGGEYDGAVGNPCSGARPHIIPGFQLVKSLEGVLGDNIMALQVLDPN